MSQAKKITVAVIGAGNRGSTFAQIIRDFPQLAEVTAVAEPRQDYRERFARERGLKADMVFESWEQFASRPRMCDAVVVSTLDRDHAAPAVACLDRGYHMLLEKPMAPMLEDCRAIEAAQRRAGTIVTVCHSLRYHKGFAKLKELIAAGRVGRVLSLDQLEQVGNLHQAHSFVRGNWGNEARQTFMLMAKSCHDIDFLAYLAGADCRRVTSFGSLSYFRRENAPAGAADRCTDGCPLEHRCVYSAIRQYATGNLEQWPRSVICAVHTPEAHYEALRTGPYGRCVWKCDNDVVDHQVVAMEFDREITATFTMTAFTQGGGRRIRVHGTEGDITFEEDHSSLTLRPFGEHNAEVIRFGPEPGGHGGGDARVVHSWLEAMRRSDPGLVLTNVQESLKTHTIVFAAERSRRERRMVEMAEMTP
ncbi:MAG: Gfo/Idh/MocA family oxidoreductase [bacterium]|nr:Gfo/Idh/MocA family oxidoreductase [bacterium]